MRANATVRKAAAPARGGLLACAALALLVPACSSDGHLDFFGYTTRPNYDSNIRTVRVPIFVNKTIIQRLEFDLTRAVIREIGAKTPFRVVDASCDADTELTGTITAVNKNLLTVSQLNEIRHAETVVAVEVVWKDLRSGEILSKPSRRPGEAVPVAPTPPLVLGLEPGAPVAPTAPFAAPAAPGGAPAGPRAGAGPAAVAPPVADAPAPAVAAVPPPPPPVVILRSLGNYVPELGQSTATSLQQNVDSMATQIVSMMEKPW